MESMNKGEERARSICAWCNWAKERKDCPHREWPSGKWYKKPMWDWKKCNDWKYYLRKPHEKLIRRIRRLLRWHKWFEDMEYAPARLIRTCTICGKREEYRANRDYTRGMWFRIGKAGYRYC